MEMEKMKALESSFRKIYSQNSKDFPYNVQLLNTIKSFRKTHDGKLFFDLLLTEIAFIPHPEKLYPPKTFSDLKKLYFAVENSQIDELKKNCYHYYVLKDWNMDEKFSCDVFIPIIYRKLMDSYWYLDRMRFQDAFSSLCTPNLIPNFPEKILNSFYFLSGERGPQMTVAYISLMSLPLDTDEKLNLYMSALIKVDIPSAYSFLKCCFILKVTFFEKIIEHCLSTPQSTKWILELPFTKEEEEQLISYLKKASHALSKKILFIYLINKGKRIEAIELSKSIGSDFSKSIEIADFIKGLNKSLLPVEKKIIL
ncbi:uncharacterized protein T551_01576 [Pneumocystis jirovecii RU7]|uniref:ELYS-like domain-containing protein n=1 Tax=Pneumocystis jirovecii (strain RU7) TaxID=1408657 RepID=A0A0W4ZRM2_PNEJ7|nr:uncharacterized protein T551_01576 [Pneumocystis jirovecii RU7]KTW31024.1 hypothetical protein T551_01576 [Pneumocystis jirovecii RU7]